MDYINTSSHQRVGGNAKIHIQSNEHQKKASLVEKVVEPQTQEINQDDAWTVIKAYFK